MKIEPRKDLKVRIPVSLHEALVEQAEIRVVSVNLLVKLAVKKFLAELPPLEDIR